MYGRGYIHWLHGENQEAVIYFKKGLAGVAEGITGETFQTLGRVDLMILYKSCHRQQPARSGAFRLHGLLWLV